MAKSMVIGSVALDSVKTPKGEVERALGGSASYGSVAMSYFAPTSLVGVVGQDFPQDHVDTFKKRGIDVSGLKTEEGETFHWSGYYEGNMDQAHTLSTHLNVFEHFRPDLTPAQAKIPFVFLANIDPELQLHVCDQLVNPKLVALDTMNLWIDIAKDKLTKVIERVSVLLMNEEEARQYCETQNLMEAGSALLKMGPQSVVIKKGADGALVFQKDGMFTIPAIPLRDIKDPTGAGDTFAGAMVGYMARLGRATEDNLRRAVVIGTSMASFVVENFSLARTMSLRGAELEGRVDQLIQMTKIPRLNRQTLDPIGSR